MEPIDQTFEVLKLRLEIDNNGSKRYYNHKNQLHKIHGPATEWADGRKEWWINDKRHRVDGPAIEWADGRKEWWINDERHRVDGPAIEYPSGFKKWYLNDEKLTKAKFLKHPLCTIK